jgi:hypothetical protein
VWLVALCAATCAAVACGGDDDNLDEPAGGSGGAGGSAGSTGKGGSGKGGTTNGKGGSSGQAGDGNAQAGSDSGQAGNGQAGDGSVGGSSGQAGANAGGVAGAGTSADLGCLGDPLPGTVNASIVISGTVTAVGAGLLAGATVEGHLRANDNQLDSDTTLADGVFTLTLDTGTTPLDAYLSLTATTYVDTFVYPPVPFIADVNPPLFMVTDTQLDAAALAGGVTRDADTGVAYVLVIDCNGDPIEGATITTLPAGDLLYTANGIPSAAATSTDADGRAIVFNLPADDLTVDAEVGGTSLREHILQLRADAVTVTAVMP